MIEIYISEDGSAEILLDLFSLDSIIDLCNSIFLCEEKFLDIDNNLNNSINSIKIYFDKNISNYTFNIFQKDKALYLELNKGGLDLFLSSLISIKKETLQTGRAHYHYMTEEWAGNELTKANHTGIKTINMLTIYVKK